MARHLFTLLALLLFQAAGGSAAHASPTFPDVFAEALDLSCGPTCLTCHTVIEGGPATTNTKVGINLRKMFSASCCDDAAMRQVAVKLAESRLDSDGDGESDADELRAQSDPNDAANAQPLACAPPAKSDGSCALRPGAGERAIPDWCAALALCIFVWRARRQRARVVLPLLVLALSLSLFACDSDGSAAGNDAGNDAAEPEDAAEEGGSELDAGLADAGELDAEGQGERQVRIRFRGRMGSREYGCNQTYAGQGSTRVDVTGEALRFFVSDVRLIDEQGAEVRVVLEPRPPGQNAELALVNLQNPEGACGSGQRSNTEIIGTVPPGSYHGLAFRVGVPAELNHGDPALATEPMRGSGLAWNWLQGYRFFVAEVVRVPQSGDAGALPNAALQAPDGGDAAVVDASESGGGGAHGSSGDPGVGVLHLGSTGCTGAAGGTIACSKSNRPEIKLDAYDVDSSVVVLDLSAIFGNSDLTAGATCHARGEACASMFTAFGLDYDTGMSLGTQRVFRLE